VILLIATPFKVILLLPTILATATMKPNDFIATTVIHTATTPHGVHLRSRVKDVDFRRAHHEEED